MRVNLIASVRERVDYEGRTRMGATWIARFRGDKAPAHERWVAARWFVPGSGWKVGATAFQEGRGASIHLTSPLTHHMVILEGEAINTCRFECCCLGWAEGRELAVGQGFGVGR